MNSLLSSCTSHQSFTGITMDYPSLLKLCPKLRHFPSWTTRGASHSPSWPQEGWLWDPGEAMSSRTWHWRLIDFGSSIIRPIMTYHFFWQNLRDVVCSFGNGCCLKLQGVHSRDRWSLSLWMPDASTAWSDFSKSPRHYEWLGGECGWGRGESWWTWVAVSQHPFLIPIRTQARARDGNWWYQ